MEKQEKEKTKKEGDVFRSKREDMFDAMISNKVEKKHEEKGRGGMDVDSQNNFLNS